MVKRKRRIRHAAIVDRFAARLREVRTTRGLTQMELARKAGVTGSYVWRLENARTAPGIDLVERLASALGTTAAELLPTDVTPDTDKIMLERARELFERLVKRADRDTLAILNPLLARLVETSR